MPDSFPATRQQLLDRLAALGIAVTTVDHAAVFTVAESAGLHQEIAGGHSKNLFLQDKKGRLFLVVALAETRVDLKALQRRLKVDRWSFGKPELLHEVLGVTAGSVTPFALINDAAGRVTVILDEAMMAFERLNFHPLENTATTSIAREDLLRFIRATGREPLVLKVSAEPKGEAPESPAGA
ncbi:MAG: prolyl-tRNA synthetase associated domain-containing protein [Hyphomicrobiaceae bacterium]|nr:prolyl-tRNA synthetase associated domain-containing protein [Hyphomicrobiaceae bacterium]